MRGKSAGDNQKSSAGVVHTPLRQQIMTGLH